MSENARVPWAVRLYTKEANGLADTKIEFDDSELAYTVPVVGDLIVDPGVLDGLDRRVAQNRQVFEVLDRYFLPSPSRNPIYFALVVSMRPGGLWEHDIVTNT